MARIRIYIARHLCNAPRAQKEAEALAAAGHDVFVHGISHDRELATRDAGVAASVRWRWEPVADYAGADRKRAWLHARIRHRLAREWFERTGRVVADVWGYGNARCARHAADHPADLTIMHSEGGLWNAQRIAATGRRIGVDFEDWFSRDLAPAQRWGRPVQHLETLERWALGNAAYVTTTSRSLAGAMAAEFATPTPRVIYNTFPAGPEPAARPRGADGISLHWFSQVIGPERGLENLFRALPNVRGSWSLHLRGKCDAEYRRGLLDLLPETLRQRIHFHATVPPAELPAAIAQHDIGLSLELSAIPSRNLTITNKFFHYLQAGLAVVASDTAGHREGLLQAQGAGLVFAHGDTAGLANALSGLIEKPEALRAAQRAARSAFVARLAQEHQRPLYAEYAAAALRAPTTNVT